MTIAAGQQALAADVRKLYELIASDNLRNSNDTTKITTSGSYVKVKEIKVNEAYDGYMRIKFTMSGYPVGNTPYCKLYKNGIAIGAERTGGTNWQIFSEDFDFNLSANDLLQVYAKSENPGDTTSVKNFRLYYNKKITDMGVDTIENPDILTDYTASITNQDP